MPRYQFESEFLHGLHDPGGEGIMRDAGCRGWVLFTEAIGSNPGDHGGSGQYAGLRAEGFGIIVRLNNGYAPGGTIPHSNQYANFAQRCANFVRNSPGAKIWIIGNETNFRVERPGVAMDAVRGPAVARGGDEPSPRELRDRFALRPGQARDALAGTRGTADGSGEVITPELYARCYTLCRNAIHSLPEHGDDLVLISAVAPWNVDTAYGGNPSGDWVQYFQDILTRLGPGGCDGISLHTYTHGYNLALIDQDTFMNPPFNHRHFDFRCYVDFMEAIPDDMRLLPVYITEADQDQTWEDRSGSTWIQRAYAEIDRWNRQPGSQQIRALILYRWPKHDRWWIVGKNNVIDDFRQAMQHHYRWNPEAVSQPVIPPPSEFNTGQEAYVSAVVNVRRSPGYLNKPGDDIYGQIAHGAPVTITGASSQADGLTWWPIRGTLSSGEPVDGWMAEVAPDGTRLLSVEVLAVERGADMAPLG